VAVIFPGEAGLRMREPEWTASVYTRLTLRLMTDRRHPRCCHGWCHPSLTPQEPQQKNCPWA